MDRKTVSLKVSTSGLPHFKNVIGYDFLATAMQRDVLRRADGTYAEHVRSQGALAARAAPHSALPPSAVNNRIGAAVILPNQAKEPG